VKTVVLDARREHDWRHARRSRLHGRRDDVRHSLPEGRRDQPPANGPQRGADDLSAVTFLVPIPLGDPMPEVGDLYMFGESGTESRELLVKEIVPADDLTARLVCLDYAPGVYAADTGAIRAYSPGITRRGTRRTSLRRRRRSRASSSDEAAYDGDTPRMIAFLDAAPVGTPAVEVYEGQFQETGATSWNEVMPVAAGRRTSGSPSSRSSSEPRTTSASGRSRRRASSRTGER